MEPCYITVAAGQDLAHSDNPRLLHLCAKTGASPVLLSSPPRQTGEILGLCEGRAVPDIPLFCEQLCAQAQTCGAVFSDLEHPDWAELTAQLDRAAHEHNLTCYVPLCMADAAPHAILTASTAVSGGSLRSYFNELLYRYGDNRIAALLERTSVRFALPSEQPEGEPLDKSEREQLLRRHGSTVFFSSELCANYFTFGDTDGSYFVLFDDKSTFTRKLDILDELGVRDRFVLYPDAAEFEL